MLASQPSASWTIEDKEANHSRWLNIPTDGHPKGKHEIGSSFFSANKYDVGPHYGPHSTSVCGRRRPLYENLDSPLL